MFDRLEIRQILAKFKDKTEESLYAEISNFLEVSDQEITNLITKKKKSLIKNLKALQENSKMSSEEFKLLLRRVLDSFISSNKPIYSGLAIKLIGLSEDFENFSEIDLESLQQDVISGLKNLGAPVRKAEKAVEEALRILDQSKITFEELFKKSLSFLA